MRAILARLPAPCVRGQKCAHVCEQTALALARVVYSGGCAAYIWSGLSCLRSRGASGRCWGFWISFWGLSFFFAHARDMDAHPLPWRAHHPSFPVTMPVPVLRSSACSWGGRDRGARYTHFLRVGVCASCFRRRRRFRAILALRSLLGGAHG
ncbi:hypothetical protein B0H16DRAFT_1530007 [Mycena metata]|uniref:Uncharacterized protein n=1 Tax=Mycena metata TaxID=1033252 RepID=A0AAD7JCU4_9AGAR|nr:hypothetical protein B0H16DRAFT_1530007 [Mycena metata]